MVDERKTVHELTPGMRAPAAGTYEQRDVLGAYTGLRVTVVLDELLPAAPRGFTWQRSEDAGTG